MRHHDDATAETFADIVRDLRLSPPPESQLAFGVRFNRSRSYIANIEHGEVYRPFLAQLLEAFPEHEGRIRAAFDVSTKLQQLRRPRDLSNAFRRMIDTLTVAGDFSQVVSVLAERLKTATDDAERQWMHARLSVALSALGRKYEARDAVESSIYFGELAGLRDAEEAGRMRLAIDLQSELDFRRAHETLNDGLRRFPDSHALWLQKGTLCWYETAYAEAYACLGTALKCGAERAAVLLVRGQVLAEWYSFPAAMTDLDTCLADSHHAPDVEAALRSARAFVLGQGGEMDEALCEFEIARQLSPGSGWLHYRRAICYATAKQMDKARDALKLAMRCRNPKLAPPRRYMAESLLGGMGIYRPIRYWSDPNIPPE